MEVNIIFCIFSIDVVSTISILPATRSRGRGRLRQREVPGSRVRPSHVATSLQSVEI